MSERHSIQAGLFRAYPIVKTIMRGDGCENIEAMCRLLEQGGTAVFLRMMNAKCQDDFLKLAIELCRADGNFGDAEREMMRLYGEEAGKTDEAVTRYYEEQEEKEKAGESAFQCESRIRGLIEAIKDHSDEKERKIVLFELLGLAYADAHFAKAEKKFIRSAKDAFGIEDDFVEKAAPLLEQYMDLQKKITKHVFG